MKKKQQTDQINIKVEPLIKKMIEDKALKERRSVTQSIVIAIERYCADGD